MVANVVLEISPIAVVKSAVNREDMFDHLRDWFAWGGGSSNTYIFARMTPASCEAESFCSWIVHVQLQTA